jgi:hypothetical protein
MGVVSVPAASVTVTVAVPDLLGSTVELARMVRAVALSLTATVSVPSLIAVPAPPPSTDQVRVWAGLLVPVTDAVNVDVPPLATLAVEGLTVTLVTVGTSFWSPYTVTVAVPNFVVSTVELAFTVSVVRVSSEATVRRPPELIVVPAALPVSTMDQITVWSALPVMATVAVNCRVPPLATPGVAGLTVTPVSTDGVVTVMVAVPDLLGSTVEAALTVRIVALSLAPTVRRPLELMLVPFPPPSTVQETVWTGLLFPLTAAVNCWVAPLATAAVVGLTVTLVTVGLSGSLVRSGQAVKKRNGISAARTSRRCLYEH